MEVDEQTSSQRRQVASESDPSPDQRETFTLGKYCVVHEENNEAAIEKSFSNSATADGIDDVFRGCLAADEAEWTEKGVYLAAPETTDLTIKFAIPS